MSDNVVSLNGTSFAPQRSEPVESLVEELERLLLAAKSGEIIGFAGDERIKGEGRVKAGNVPYRRRRFGCRGIRNCGCNHGRCSCAFCKDEVNRRLATQTFAGKLQDSGVKAVADPALDKTVGRSDGYPAARNGALERLYPGHKLLLPELFLEKRETVLPEFVHSSLSGGAGLAVTAEDGKRLLILPRIESANQAYGGPVKGV